MAKYKKKRARELQHDKFRDTAISVFDRLGNALEGKGKTVLYALIGVVVAAVLVGLGLRWSNKKADEARRALGRGITIATTPITNPSAPVPPTGPTFSSDRDRAQAAIYEFQKVAAKYGDPYRSQANYFAATNMLYVDRNKGITELAELTRSGVPEVAALSKFALAQTKTADGKYDEAAQLLSEVARQNNTIVTPDTANLELANAYEKQGKKSEAVELLFAIVEASRKAKDADGTPATPTAASREASEKLQKLDPDRYAKLTPELPGSDIPF